MIKYKTRGLTGAEIKMVFEGRKAINLWDMTLILANDGPAMATALMAAAFALRIPNAVVTSAIGKDIQDTLERTEGFCDKMQLVVGKARLRAFRSQISQGCTTQVVAAEFEGLWHNIIEELGSRWLVFIPADKHQFVLEHKQAFYGACCLSAFSPAKNDINSAGDCLLADLNTAAVFHLMRVAEFGLRRIAKDLRVKLPKNKPITYATWGDVLRELDVKLEALRGKSDAKEKRRTFYSGLVLPVKAFQHLWRNPVSHFRGEYDEKQAQSAYIHVGAFIQRLVEKTAQKY